MTFLEKLDFLMESQSINKSKLSKISGVPYTTIDGFYKKGYENTKLSTIRRISDALNVSIDYLTNEDEDDKTSKIKKSSSLPDEAMKIAKDYWRLDRWGRKVVRSVISDEQARMEDETRFFKDIEPEPAAPKVIPLYWSAPAAGIASPILGEDYDLYELKPEDPQGAVFAVTVGGDSMEPHFPEGSIAFCNKDTLQDGDIGVFSIDGESVIKQYHYDSMMGMTYLFSLNRKRSDADVLLTKSTGRTLVCLGRVITKKRYPVPGMY